MIDTKEIMIESFDNTKLYMKTDLPQNMKAVLVVVHGLCEHQGRYDHLVKQFNAANVGTYRFDHRGHGRSEGHKAHLSTFHELLDDTNVIIDLAIEAHPDLPVFVLGHSMGGFTVSLYGAKYPNKKIKGFITSGTLVKDEIGLITSVPKGLDLLMPLPNELGSGVCSVKEVVDWYAIDPYNGKSFTPGLCYALCDGVDWFSEKIHTFNYPVFIMHGEKDGLVSEKDSVFFFKNIQSFDRQLKIYGGLFHEIFNEYNKEEVINDAVVWLLNRI